MKVLHILSDIGISNGVLSVITNYLRHMPKDIQFDVAYFMETSDNRREELETLGANVFLIQAPNMKSFFQKAETVFSPVCMREYQILHLHLPYLASVYANKARKLGVKKVVVHCHSTWYSLNKHNNLRNRILNTPTKLLSDIQIACGEDAGMFWYKRGYINLPNAISTEQFCYNEAARKRLRRELHVENRFVIGHVGRVFPPQKNHPFILKIFSKILQICPDAELLLVGADPDNELISIVNELGIQNSVHFLGKRKDVHDILSAMDVFFFPSLYEGLPVALIEAQAAGLKCVASTAISEEAKVLPTTEFIPLDADETIWVNIILEGKKAYCRKVNEWFANSKWNLQSASRILEEIYRM